MATYAKTGYAPTHSNEYEVPLIAVNGDVVPSSSQQNNTKRSPYCSRSSSSYKCNKHFYKTEKNTTLSGSRKPVNLPVCPHCGTEHIRTRTKTYPTAATWASVGVGAVVFFPLCWIPLVSDSMKKTDHYCQACGNKIGTVKPLEGFCVKESS